MTTRITVALLATLFLAPSAPATPELVWQDEFDGNQLDLAKWQPQIGTGCPSLCGWGNNELQYYRAENAVVSGGVLTITAKEESFGGQDYTSARLRTRNLGDWKWGRFEMRAKLPIGQGIWPAFWMLPTDNVYGGWAASGEIDIMEYVGQEPDRVFGTLHYGGSAPENVWTSNQYQLPSGTFHDDFHVFALEWDECEMRWYVDDVHYATQKNWWSTGGPYPAPFDQEFHILLNMAVGGNLPGPPDGTTVFPQEFVVDYVRVYRDPAVDLGACTTIFDDMEHANPFGNGWFSFGGTVGGGGISANVTDLPPVEACRASLESGWGSGGTPGFFGGFGRYFPTELPDATHFTFWIHPDAGQEYTLEINLQDDDNGDGSIPGTPDGADDEFQYDCVVGPFGPDVLAGGGWQRVSIPLADFFDDNSYHFGGNGVFDPVAPGSGGNGELIAIVVTVNGDSGSDVTFRTDRWAFTRQEAEVAGRVWSDADGDGTIDGGEAGIAGVLVELFDLLLATSVATDVTDAGGSYTFPDRRGGAFEVRVNPGTLPPGASPTFDPDGIATPDRFEVGLECLEIVADGDFGYAVGITGTTPGEGVRIGLRNDPNPFGPSTLIRFDLPREQPVVVEVVDVAGRLVATLVRDVRPAGTHGVRWDGRDGRGVPVAAGVYFTVLRTAEETTVRKMAVLR